MIHRTFDHHHIATLAEHPDAAPWIAPSGPLNWSAILAARDSNVLVRDDETDAHALYQFRAPGVWELHVICPPAIRGKRAVKSIVALMAWWEDAHDGTLFAKCHVENRRVAFLAPHCGLRFVETRDGQAYFARA